MRIVQVLGPDVLIGTDIHGTGPVDPYKICWYRREETRLLTEMELIGAMAR